MNEPKDFIREIIERDLRDGVHDTVATRFPPEPNGFLHIGHAKAICLDFGVAEEYGGTCNLRFDDTNPTTEDIRYVEAIEEDVGWLGFEWDGPTRHASDYFEQFYELAERLILDGKAYVDSQSEEQIRATRGTVTEAGTESPHRERADSENLELFRRMRAGEFPDGEHVLRARIDIAAPNMKMRDPLLYRIRHAAHYRTGDDWCIYPFYDWAHPLSDAIEGITHSLCTLEFENNRELYDWVLDNTRPQAGAEPGSWSPRPRQYEFARLNLDYTVMSKRKLKRLVDEGFVDGWDDPRMPTLAGLRRRGVTPESIRRFCDEIGIARADNRVDISLLEYAMRDDLNHKAPRVMCVLDPLKVVVTNYPDDDIDELDCPHWPRDVPREGSRPVPFGRELFIERDDFREDPPDDFYRLAPGREVRLRYAYFVRCEDVVRDPDSGEIVELRCTYDPETRGGSAPDGRRVRGTLHWVSADRAVLVRARLYDRLFAAPDPEAGGGDFLERLNPDSLEEVPEALAEPAVAAAPTGFHYQFERHGYFYVDPQDSAEGAPVFNRTVSLRDTWARIEELRHAAEAEEIEEEASAAATAAEQAPAGGEEEPSQPQPVPEPRTREEIVAELEAEDPATVPRFRRYVDELDLPLDDAEILARDAAVAGLFEDAVAAHPQPRSVANWVVNEVLRELKETPADELPFDGTQLGRLVALVDEGRVTGPAAKEVLTEMTAGGGDPEEIVERRGLEAVANAEELAPVVDRVLEAHPDKVEEYRGGHEGLFGFFMGQVMRETCGTADPGLARELLARKLG